MLNLSKQNREALNNGNYPAGFNGFEGELEVPFIFELDGEVELIGYTEEEAKEELMSMTIREAIARGLFLH